MAENGTLKPRLCKIVKGESGYGFHLHGEKGKVGQRIRKVEEGSAAQSAGLRVGDKIIFINGANVEKQTHQDVVKLIKEKENETEMLVVDEETESYFREKGIPITIEMLANGTDENGERLDMPQAEPPKAEETVQMADDSDKAANNGVEELRPRLCKLQKPEGSGFGFNLHSEKGKPGRYIRSVDPGTPAETAGVRGGDRIIEVNGVNLEYEKHARIVTAIKESGSSVSLLLVDEETDKFFKSCEVTPSETHLSGPLPTPKPPKEVEPEVDLLTMDVTKLKEMTQSSKKKRPPPSDWQNRQAMFNNL